MASLRNTPIRPNDAVRDSLEVAIRKPVVKRAGVKAVDRDGWMLLYNVTQASRETLFGSLPRRVQNVVAVDNDGRTPLHHTAEVSLGDAIWALVENSIDVRAVGKGMGISLYDAARPGSEVAIWALVVQGRAF
jgi:hypothetical protein